MDLTRWLKNSDTVRDCEVLFVVLCCLGFLWMIILFLACWLEAPRGLFLAAIAYCVPGAILCFFAASLYFARWLFLSEGGRATNGANGAP